MTTRMLLQHMVRAGGGWTHGIPFSADDATAMQAAAEQMTQRSTVWWRIVRDTPALEVLAVHDGHSWKTVGEAMPAPTDLPWWQNSLQTAFSLLRARHDKPARPAKPAEPDDFPPTQPMERPTP